MAIEVEKFYAHSGSQAVEVLEHAFDKILVVSYFGVA